MVREEFLNIVDELDCVDFDTYGETVQITKVTILGEIAFDDRVNTLAGCHKAVFRPSAVLEQFAVLSLNLPIGSCEPCFESECFVVEDDCDLQVTMLERRRDGCGGLP